jgi:hypothetical protein
MQARASAGSANVPACFRLEGKKAAAVKARRKTDFPIMVRALFELLYLKSNERYAIRF